MDSKEIFTFEPEFYKSTGKYKEWLCFEMGIETPAAVDTLSLQSLGQKRTFIKKHYTQKYFPEIVELDVRTSKEYKRIIKAHGFLDKKDILSSCGPVKYEFPKELDPPKCKKGENHIDEIIRKKWKSYEEQKRKNGNIEIKKCPPEKRTKPEELFDYEVREYKRDRQILFYKYCLAMNVKNKTANNDLSEFKKTRKGKEAVESFLIRNGIKCEWSGEKKRKLILRLDVEGKKRDVKKQLFEKKDGNISQKILDTMVFSFCEPTTKTNKKEAIKFWKEHPVLLCERIKRFEKKENPKNKEEIIAEKVSSPDVLLKKEQTEFATNSGLKLEDLKELLKCHSIDWGKTKAEAQFISSGEAFSWEKRIKNKVNNQL